jgi:Family of unknown function (DUF5715)
MRPKAATAVLMMLASIQLCTALAKPTRTITRPAGRKLVLTEPATRASHVRGTRLSGAHTPTHEAHSAYTHVHPVSKGNSRSRSLAEERALAARSAIAAADRRARPEPRSSRLRRAKAARQDAAVHLSPKLRGTWSSANPDEMGDEQIPILTNVGGILRPAAATVPLRTIGEEAVTPVLLPKLRVASLYDDLGRLIMPAPLYGSHEILLHQNEMAEREGLGRVRDDSDLLDLRRENKLVALPDNATLHVDYRLPENRRYSRPWTAAFLSVMAADFYASFHTPLQVDSAVRTVAVQERLLRTNGNAAPVDGDTASPHLTGEAVDIAKGGLSRTQIAWMRTYLQPLIDLGKIDVEEEFHQSCFHISVYTSFLPSAPAHLSVAAARQIAPESLTERPTE